MQAAESKNIGSAGIPLTLLTFVRCQTDTDSENPCDKTGWQYYIRLVCVCIKIECNCYCEALIRDLAMMNETKISEDIQDLFKGGQVKTKKPIFGKS